MKPYYHPLAGNPEQIRAERRKVLQVLYMSLCIGVVIILPFIIKDRGYFFYYGDYNVQQVPFWEYVAELVKSGNWGWSWETDLGSSVIGSYSFYLLGSPFFWLAQIFPASWMPALMGPLMILKMSAAAVGAYLYMRKFVRDTDYAVIGALLYAFSSYTVYNIFFNHFIDVVAIFPFLLLAFDELVENRRWGWFALATAVALFTNYFFFIGEVIFILLYYVLRITAPDDWEFEWRTFLHIVLEAVVGVAVTAVMMVPSYLMIASNPRLNSMFNGWGFYIYGETRRYMDIVQAFLFPSELPHFTYFVEDGGTRWQSVAAWLPLVSVSGVIAFLSSKKARGSWQKRILAFCGLALLMPGVGSIFYLMKATYYSRWLYMMVLVMALVTVRVLDDYESYNLKLGMKWNLIFSALLAVPIAVLPVINSAGTVTQVGLYVKSYGAPIMFFVCIGIAAACMIAFYFLVTKLREKNNIAGFKRALTLTLSVVICVYSLFTLISGKASSESTDMLVDNSLNAADDFNIPGEDEADFYRIDVLDGMDNQGLYWRKSSINFFHSVVSPSIMEFYEFIGVERNVASRPGASLSGLRALTSVKYVFEREGRSSVNNLYGVEYLSNMYGYDVYKNTNYIPFGFTYDSYVSRTAVEELETSKRDTVMVNALMLDDEQIVKYGYLMNRVETPGASIDYSAPGLAAAAAERRTEAAYNYQRDNDGFSVEIDLEKENLVFFSLPHEDGWTATVNGVETVIEEVNAGLSAVYAPAGHVEIRFDYKTPGVSTGGIISLVGLVALIGLFVFGYLSRRNTAKTVLVAETPTDEALLAERLAAEAETAEPAELPAEPGDAPADKPEEEAEPKGNPETEA